MHLRISLIHLSYTDVLEMYIHRIIWITPSGMVLTTKSYYKNTCISTTHTLELV